jgi:hypothetical protein
VSHWNWLFGRHAGPSQPGFPTWSFSTIVRMRETRRREYLFPCSGLPGIQIISDKNYHTCHEMYKIVSLSLISFILYGIHTVFLLEIV